MQHKCFLRTAGFALISVAAVAACKSRSVTDSTPGGYCAAPRSIAVSVNVRDSISGRAIADVAMGTAQVGAMVDTLTHFDTLTLYGGEQLGTYSVSVSRAGYRTWTQPAVTVTQTGPCGNVEPVTLNARLQPTP